MEVYLSNFFFIFYDPIKIVDTVSNLGYEVPKNIIFEILREPVIFSFLLYRVFFLEPHSLNLTLYLQF